MDPAYLEPTAIIDSGHPSIAAFAAEAGGEARDDRERAVNIYYAVRDRIRYNPYTMVLTEAHFRASATLARGEGFCITKAALYAAALRAAGIPARLGFADVKNHLATVRLLEMMGSDLFIWHGYVSMFLDGRWVKATPAFNVEMCRRFGVLPLEFDGTADSLLHPFNARGERHMEYVRDRGLFDDLPLEQVAADMRASYPKLIAAVEAKELSGAFEKDVLVR